MLSQKKIKEIIEKHAGTFKALEEYDKTGKMVSKTRMNFTLDREHAKKFRDYCKKKGYNMSNKIEEFMEGVVRENRKL